MARTPVQRGTELVVVGVDTGLATLGIASVQGDPALGVRGARCIRLEYQHTKKLTKKMRELVRTSTDDRNRVDFLVDAVERVVEIDAAHALAVEWFAPNPKQKGFASGAWKAAVTVGGCLRLGRGRRMATMEQLPSDVKKLVGTQSASKADITAWLCDHLAGFREALAALDLGEADEEHPSDAAGHALVGLIELGKRRRDAAL